jgi:NAD-dependent oxidoreductase involved in siderophore biosynthesis
MNPTAHRLLQHCDGVLRLPGASQGADQDVRIAGELGLPVWHAVEDIPEALGAAA